MCLTEAQVIDLAAGYCPRVVQAMARTLLETRDDFARKVAARQAADAARTTRGLKERAR